MAVPCATLSSMVDRIACAACWAAGGRVEEGMSAGRRSGSLRDIPQFKARFDRVKCSCSAADPSLLRLIGDLGAGDRGLAPGRRQRQKDDFVILLQHDLATADLAQDPAAVQIAQFQPDDLVRGLIKENPECLLLAADRSDQRELGSIRLDRRCCARWWNIGCCDNRWRWRSA